MDTLLFFYYRLMERLIPDNVQGRMDAQRIIRRESLSEAWKASGYLNDSPVSDKYRKGFRHKVEKETLREVQHFAIPAQVFDLPYN